MMQIYRQMAINCVYAVMVIGLVLICHAMGGSIDRDLNHFARFFLGFGIVAFAVTGGFVANFVLMRTRR